MDAPRTEPSRLRERLAAAFLDVLFPKAAPAEVLLFFAIVYTHLVSYRAAIQHWVTRCFRNGWDGLVMPIQGGVEGVGDLLIILGGLFHFLLILWMLLLLFLVVIFPLLAALIMGSSTSFERK